MQASDHQRGDDEQSQEQAEQSSQADVALEGCYRGQGIADRGLTKITCDVAFKFRGFMAFRCVERSRRQAGIQAWFGMR